MLNSVYAKDKNDVLGFPRDVVSSLNNLAFS